MIRALDAMAPEHLRLLYVISTTTEARPDLYMGGASDTLNWKMPDVPEEETRRLWAELHADRGGDALSDRDHDEPGRGQPRRSYVAVGRRFVELLDLEAGYGFSD